MNKVGSFKLLVFERLLNSAIIYQGVGRQQGWDGVWVIGTK